MDELDFEMHKQEMSAEQPWLRLSHAASTRKPSNDTIAGGRRNAWPQRRCEAL